MINDSTSGIHCFQTSGIIMKLYHRLARQISVYGIDGFFVVFNPLSASVALI